MQNLYTRSEHILIVVSYVVRDLFVLIIKSSPIWRDEIVGHVAPHTIGGELWILKNDTLKQN